MDKLEKLFKMKERIYVEKTLINKEIEKILDQMDGLNRIFTDDLDFYDLLQEYNVKHKILDEKMDYVDYLIGLVGETDEKLDNHIFEFISNYKEKLKINSSLTNRVQQTNRNTLQLDNRRMILIEKYLIVALSQ